VFDRLVEFIQKSGIPIAMVGLLQAMPGTQLFRRLWKEGRILDAGGGNNTDCQLTFIPRMNATRPVESYRAVLNEIYACNASYERVKLFLSRCHPRRRQRLNYSNLSAFFSSLAHQGILQKGRLSYWEFLLTAVTSYRSSFGTAMTLAVMGHHVQTVTQASLKG
jgi:hypothetical protein